MVQLFNRKIGFTQLSMMLAIVILLEGGAIAVNARQIDRIDSLGNGLFQSTVMFAGLQLLALGAVALLAIILPGRFIKLNAMLTKLMSWVPFVIGAIVAIEGLVIAFIASPMTLAGGVGVRSFWLAGFGAQLFFFGISLVSLHLFQKRLNLQLMIRKALFLVLASVGVFVIGIAESTTIAGIGGIRGGTVELLGAELVVLSLLGVVIMYMDRKSIFGRQLFGHRLGAISLMGVATLLSLEGLVLASLAGKFTIVGMGTMEEWVMVLAGIGIAIISLLIPASYYIFEKKDLDAKKLATTACLFLVFLLPFSLLM